MMKELKFAKLSNKAKAPSKHSPFACALDLYSAEDVVIPSQASTLIKTDIALCPPHGYYCRIASRSGHAVAGLHVMAGCIDPDFTGNVEVLLYNISPNEFIIRVGDRIAQVICEKFTQPVLVQVPELEITTRGTSGFGSTGGQAKKRTIDNNPPSSE